MTDAMVSTLRLRGPGARRLAHVAATTLPHALEAALADMGDVRLDAMHVTLGINPDDYDDVTLAALWADTIRAELLQHASPQRPGASATPGRERVSNPGSALDAARRWLDAGGSNPIPAAVLELTSGFERDGAADSVGGSELYEDTVTRVDEAIGRLRARIAAHAELRDAAASGLTPGAASTPRAVGHVAEPRPTDAPREPQTSAPDGANPAMASGREGVRNGDVRAATAWVTALAELVAGAAGGAEAELDLEALTGCAGLALLYPWLGDLCREAVSLHPGLDEASVRTHALAALVDPDDPGLHVDPLIALLAANPDARIPQNPLPRADEIRAAADAVLSSFARLLPGFGDSTPEFVRREWIRRIGVLDLEADPARLTAATHPLDVVLSALPYPLGLFRLPWSAPVMVRFAP